MTRTLIAALLFVGAAGGFVGCNNPSAPAPQPAGSPAPAAKEGDVHVRTPGAAVDVEKKGDGKGVTVDVRTKKE